MTSVVSKVYHITVFSWYVLIVKSLLAKEGEELPAGIFVYGGPWKYLTFLNLLLQMVFFGLAAVHDLQPGKKSENILGKSKDLLFSVFAFPVGMFVVLLFWSIFVYDRELVYPATIDTFFPPWINHAMVSIVLVQPHTFPQTKHALALILWVYMSVGIWVYPLLGLFSTPGLVGFFFFNMSVVFLLFQLGKVLNRRVWASRYYVSTTDKRKGSSLKRKNP
uniref:Androgen-dependent TFPI-regulating protein-like n=1 Tax=Gouania willdenowi TaxID=441366 RepID=A0A8C5NAU5_GOUWI